MTAAMRRILIGLIVTCVLAFIPSSVSAQEALSKIEPLSITTEADVSLFTVEIADTDALRERGLMFRQRLPEDRGMLFDFGQPRPVSMWMKNTYIPLDMLFIRADGVIAYIAENTTPKSLDAVGVQEPVLAVLELAGGTAKKRGIRAGDVVYHRLFNPAP
jgi:uncharacterized protein